MKPVIVDAVRTPFGRRNGWLSTVHAAEMLGAVQRAVLDRSGVEATYVDQVIGGCVTPVGEQYGNVARTAWLHAGLPSKTGVTAIDAQCGTALQAVNLLAGQIAMGAVDVGIACGVEVMSRVPLTPKSGLGLGTSRPAGWNLDMPDQHTAADRIARHRGFSRADLDAFGLRSQQLARNAWAEHKFDGQVLAMKVPSNPGDPETLVVDRDQGLRETSMEALAALRPTKEGGLHTAGTSSQVSDGASAALLMEEAHARALGVPIRGRLKAQCVVGGDTELMLDGPIDGALQLLSRTGIGIDDIEIFEVNEAFASIPMSFMTRLGVDEDKVNVNGGAIALGHPAGATGIRLLANAIDELERRDGHLAMIAICAAAATTCAIVERV
jgi:acetyl-CoA C-acetyltransferase